MEVSVSVPRPLEGQAHSIRLDRGEAERWDRYVKQHPDATAYHLSEWATIMKRSYGFEPVYLKLEGSRGEPSGVLPLLYRRGALSGRCLVSLPGDIRVAGPLGQSIEDEGALLDAACELVRSGKAGTLQVRSTKRGYDRLVAGLSVRPGSHLWLVQLPGEPEAFWERFTGRSGNLRRDVTKARRSGVSVREAGSLSDLRRFYRLYLRTMRRHRALPRTLQQFALSMRLLGPARIFRLYVAEHEGRVIAGGIFYFFRDTVNAQYNASDERYLHIRPNHALYGAVIENAIACGCRTFDFAAAPIGSSLADFKRRWGAEPVPRFHYGYPGRAGPRMKATAGIRSRLPREEGTAGMRAWGRAPLGLTRFAGAVVHRYL